jgi:hypothetical protein
MTEYNHHFKNHSKPFICPHCPARQATKRHLDRHINERHNGDELYFCPVEGCKRARGGRGFPRTENCKRHVRKVHKEGGEERIGVDIDEKTRKASRVRKLCRNIPE